MYPLLSGGQERDFEATDAAGKFAPLSVTVKKGGCGPTQVYYDNIANKNPPQINVVWSSSYETSPSKVMMAGDSVNVVWQASSGGKSQRLFKYTVQQDSPDEELE
jgi:hypothetical protein